MGLIAVIAGIVFVISALALLGGLVNPDALKDPKKPDEVLTRGTAAAKVLPALIGSLLVGTCAYSIGGKGEIASANRAASQAGIDSANNAEATEALDSAVALLSSRFRWKQVEEAREMADDIDPTEVAQEIAVRRQAILVHADSLDRIRAAHKAEPVTVQNYGACLTRELMDQFSTAQVKYDSRSGNYLLENGCIILNGGIPLTVIDRTWSLLAQIRVYVEGDAVELWVPAEAIDDGSDHAFASVVFADDAAQNNDAWGEGVPVSRAELAEIWPFVVESGVIKCRGGQEYPMLVFATGGTDYAVNGTALEEYPSSNHLRGRDPQSEMPIGDLLAFIQYGLKLCEAGAP